MIALEDRPDARWRKKEAFWNDTLVRQLIRDDVDRIEKLQGLIGADNAQLVKAANVTGLAGVGRRGVATPWRKGATELAANVEELTLSRIFAARSRRPSTPCRCEERDALEKLLAREGPRRWRRFIEGATAEAMLNAAIDAIDGFRVTRVHLADMEPEARFNFWLCYANRAIEESANPAIRKRKPRRLTKSPANSSPLQAPEGAEVFAGARQARQAESS